MPSKFCEDTASDYIGNQNLSQSELRLGLVEKILSNDRKFAAFAQVPSNPRAELCISRAAGPGRRTHSAQKHVGFYASVDLEAAIGQERMPG